MMNKYIPMKGPLPGKQWTPSNASSGEAFMSHWCGDCARDKAMREGASIDDCDDNEKCQIIVASFRGEAVEWRENDDGGVECLAYIEVGKPIPPPRDEKTLDMFVI